MIDVNQLPWQKITGKLNEKGFVVIPDFLNRTLCEELISLYPCATLFRKTVNMERHRFGQGEYKYFNYPLPQVVQKIREMTYPHLTTIANDWMKLLNIDIRYPDNHEAFVHRCHQHGQRKPTPLILEYKEGGYNTLHQDLYGAVYFPLQLVVCLSDYGTDFDGGEFVLTEQVPRAQSSAHVLKLSGGEALLFATTFRPVKGKRGYYKTVLKHGISEVTKGNRYALGIIFHDALN